jgi:hypothetical protein
MEYLWSNYGVTHSGGSTKTVQIPGLKVPSTVAGIENPRLLLQDLATIRVGNDINLCPGQ